MKVVIIGFGAMGQGIAQLISIKEGCIITGIIDQNPQLLGKNLSEFISIEEQSDVAIEQDVRILKQLEADIAIITTGSHVEIVSPIILEAVKAGLNVITIAEEMAYPMVADPILAKTIDEKAKEKGVTVLGTGINPGFIMDMMIVFLSSISHTVTKVKAVRVNDLSAFGSTVLDSQGVGKTVEEFEKGIQAGEIVGHVGFPQSIALIADAFGWKIDEVIETKEPIVSNVQRKHDNYNIEAGMVVGCNHSAIAMSHGEVVIELEHPQQILPHAEGIKTRDEILIKGTPNVELVITPEIPGGLGTVAIVVNMLPLIVKAQNGLITMNDLPGIPSIFNGVIE